MIKMERSEIEERVRAFLIDELEIDEDKPVLVDKYIVGKEVEVDAICDGRDVFVPGIMELVDAKLFLCRKKRGVLLRFHGHIAKVHGQPFRHLHIGGNESQHWHGAAVRLDEILTGVHETAALCQHRHSLRSRTPDGVLHSLVL